MSMKLIGAACILLGCGGCGFLMASRHIMKIQMLRDMIAALDYMSSELQFRCTPLPQLCRQTAEQSHGKIAQLLLSLADEMDAQISPNVDRCMAAVLDKCCDVPYILTIHFVELGRNLGNFDLSGQLKGLENTRRLCRDGLDNLMQNKENRLRSYQTLGLCAGAAIVILFV